MSHFSREFEGDIMKIGEQQEAAFTINSDVLERTETPEGVVWLPKNQDQVTNQDVSSLKEK